MTENIPSVGVRRLKRLIETSIRAQAPILILGPPGIGKTSLVASVCRRMGRELHIILGSTQTEITLAGLPAIVDGIVRRMPLAVIARLRDHGGVLFLDELTCTSPTTLAALLRGLLERVFGDTQLHPEVAIVAAANEPEHAPGASDLPASVIARCCVVRLAPTAAEVTTYLATSVGVRPGTAVEEDALPTIDADALRYDGPLAAAAADYAATASAESRLIGTDPPPTVALGMCPWPSPRQIEAGVWLATVARAVAVGHGLDEAEGEEDARAVLAGCIGVEGADTYQSIRRLRQFLPTAAEIAADPLGAKVPEQVAQQLAALGLLAQVAKGAQTYAAWAYSARLAPEVRAACGRILLPYPLCGLAAHKADAERAKIAALREGIRSVR